MALSKLPNDAFEYFFGLGSSRSLQAVADHFGVNKKTVSRRATTERWNTRVDEREREARRIIDERMAKALAADGVRHAQRMAEMNEAFFEVMTPTRMKALFASIFKTAVQKDDTAAARLLIERAMGKPRHEGIAPTAISMPNGLESTADVRRAANALLQSVADGSISPEDAQKTAAVIESARKAIETDDLEKRIATIEENIKRDNSS